MHTIEKSPDYLYNHLAKSFARDVDDGRFDYGQFANDRIISSVAEPWRFPIIDCYRDKTDTESYFFNEVTFVYPINISKPPQSISLIGTFHNLYEPIPLQRLEESMYFTVTCKIPKGEVHYYKFLINNGQRLDSVNPQREILPDGVEWSRFFTHNCNVPISFERWEWVILERLTDHILPFRTTDARRFLNNYYQHLDKQSKETSFSRAYLLDQSVGVVNFIDKLIAREEHHRLKDYKVCLEIIDKILRNRISNVEPANMSRELFVQLYMEMGAGTVKDWDYSRYNSPGFFLQLLRRHTLTGAFSHPKYGGNAECAGWAFLSERYKDESGKTLFNWKLALEKPIGLSDEYYG